MALVKWSTIQLLKEIGGLGVGDILLKNAAFLYKWWWRFATEEDPLWKRVVSSCYNLNEGDSFPAQIQKSQNKGGGPWSMICNIGRVNNDVEKIILNGMQMMVGNGQQTCLWEDL